ncbi:hypothetical protein [Ruminococcus flavefaciens]|uniref:hypothetical protein n=1 Tax=Ruminococcus flavefaciens TaxID=1265 RepID=UPI0026F1AB85|nr:hypothetical protein [Ruminococcus flavefaciens]
MSTYINKIEVDDFCKRVSDKMNACCAILFNIDSICIPSLYSRYDEIRAHLLDMVFENMLALSDEVKAFTEDCALFEVGDICETE